MRSNIHKSILSLTSIAIALSPGGGPAPRRRYIACHRGTLTLPSCRRNALSRVECNDSPH